jgi:hypothetical protein
MSCHASLSISLAHSWASPSVCPPIFLASDWIVSSANLEPKGREIAVAPPASEDEFGGDVSASLLEEFSEDSVFDCASLLFIGHLPQPVSFMLSQAFEYIGMFRWAFALVWAIKFGPVHSKKSILRMKTAFIDCAEANFLFVIAICIVLR